ncbi:phage portal protein [Pseudomonas aeruginosa]
MARYPHLTRAGFMLPDRIKNSYDGAGTGRRAQNWDAPPGSINTLSLPALPLLRKRSRAATRNDPYAGGAIDTRVSNLIGSGIVPMPTTQDKALRRLLLELWLDWTDESDADERTDFYGQQALAARMVEESGECFIRLRPRRPEDDLAVPLQLQLLPAEFVPVEKNEVARNGNLIRAGIEFNALGRQQLQAAAMGTGVPYELFTGDLRNVNDRVIRVVLNEFRRRLEQLQFSVYIHQLCRPVRAAWMDMAYLSGALDLPDYARRRREYLRTRWVPQGWEYIHPVQDVQGKVLEIQAGLASRSEVVLRKGYDAETIDEENAADQTRAHELGLNYTTAPGSPDPADEETP